MQMKATHPRARGVSRVRWLSIMVLCAVAVAACNGTTTLPIQSDTNGGGTFAPIVRGSILETVAATGTLRYAREAALTFGEPGTVQSVAVQVGQRVFQGEALAALDPAALRGEVLEAEEALATAVRRADAVRTIDTALLLSQVREAVAQARVDLNAAETALEQTRLPFNHIDRIEAEEDLASAQVALNEAVAERTVTADPTLSAEASKARDEVEAARAEVEAAQAVVEAAQTTVDAARANVETTRAAVEAAKGPAVASPGGAVRSFADLEAPIASAEEEYRRVVRRVYGLALEATLPLPSPAELRAGGIPPTTTLLGGAALPEETAALFHSRGIDWPPGGANEATGSAGVVGLEEAETVWGKVTSARAALGTARVEAELLTAEAERQAVEAQQAAEQRVVTEAERAAAVAADALESLREAQAAVVAKEEELARVTAPRPALEVTLADSRAALAGVRVEEAWQALQVLGRGPDPDQVALAEARVATAVAALEAALRERDHFETHGVEEQTAEAAAAVNAAEIRLGIARLRLERAVLTAPFDGVVAEVRTGPGASADTRSPAIVLVDPTRFAVEASVGQMEVVRVAEGQRALVSLESTLEVVEGVVESIALLPVERDGETTYDVAVGLEGSVGGPASSISGLSVQVHVVVGEVRDALLAPKSAIYREGGATLVRMLDATGALRDRPVTLGRGNALWMRLASGVAEGDRVLLAEADGQSDALVRALAPSTRTPSANVTEGDGTR